MFAGAAREAVFSNPAVAKRVKEKFIPVAIKAKVVARSPGGSEGEIYKEVRRTQHVPQGIATMNSAGKVLTWAFSFDNEESILKFLDHVETRYQKLPDDKQQVAAERFMSFPGRKLPDVADNNKKLKIPTSHAAGEVCPGHLHAESGTLIGTIIGRQMDSDGKPIEKTLRQEQYMESRFELSPAAQKQLAKAASESIESKGKSFEISDSVCQALINPAFLGQLDVDPLGTSTNWDVEKHREWKLGGQVKSKSKDGIRIHLSGTSHISGGETSNPNAGRYWDHTVKLTWQGYIDIKQDRVVNLTMLAKGKERLLWGNENLRKTKSPDCTHLMAGHPIDFDGDVVYGLMASDEAEEKRR